MSESTKHTEMRARLADPLAALWQCPQSEFLARTDAVIEAASRAVLPVTDSAALARQEALAQAMDACREVCLLQTDTAKMDAAEECFNAIRALATSAASPVAGWVSVEERLPEFGQRVLAYCPKYGQRETCFDRYNEGSISRRVHGDDAGYFSWSEPTHNWASSWNPTHWQPIPAPPAPVTPKQEQS